MRDVAEQPTRETPTRETINPALKALFDVELAGPDEPHPVETSEVDPGVDKPKPFPVPKKEPVPVEKESPTAATKEDKKPADKSDITSRLAPDFAAAEITPAPVVAAEPEIENTDDIIDSAKTPKAQADLRKFRDELKRSREENKALKARPTAVPED